MIGIPPVVYAYHEYSLEIPITSFLEYWVVLVIHDNEMDKLMMDPPRVPGEHVIEVDRSQWTPIAATQFRSVYSLYKIYFTWMAPKAA